MVNSQHTAWMVVNLLARLKGVVRSIGLQCPRGIRLSGNVVPFAPGDTDLRTGLLRGRGLLESCRWSRTLNMNTRSWLVRRMARWTREVCAPMAMAGAAVFPIHRSTYVARRAPSALPFGPYIAACLAVGELFKTARMRPGTSAAVPSAFYSIWNHRASPAYEAGGPDSIDVTVDAALAGVGAVGCALIHTLWACPGIQGKVILTDNDPEGVDRTNLNR